jgi:hypothetical protein
VNCPVCHAELEIVLLQTDRDTDNDAVARRDAWASVEQDAMLREAQHGERRDPTF